MHKDYFGYRLMIMGICLMIWPGLSFIQEIEGEFRVVWILIGWMPTVLIATYLHGDNK